MRNVKLDNVVREFLIERFGAEVIDKRYARILQIAVSGVRDLNNDVGGVIKTEKVTVNDNDTARLPHDLIRPRRIALCIDGMLMTLDEDKNLCRFETDDCGNLTSNDNDDDDEIINYTHTYNGHYNRKGDFTGGFYGLGGVNSSAGTYRIDEQRGILILRNVNDDSDNKEDTDDVEIVIEYLADITKNDNNEIMIREGEREAIKAWIWWKYIQNNRSYPANEKELARREYAREKHKANMRRNGFNTRDFLKAVRHDYGLHIKY